MSFQLVSLQKQCDGRSDYAPGTAFTHNLLKPHETNPVLIDFFREAQIFEKI